MKKLILIIAIISLSACKINFPSNIQNSSSPTLEETQEFLRQYFAAQNSKDANKITSSFENNPQTVLIENGKLYSGWNEIRKSVDKSLSDNSNFKITLATISHSNMDSSTALVTAPFVITDPNNPSFTIKGTSTFLIKKIDSKFKITYEHSSANLFDYED